MVPHPTTSKAMCRPLVFVVSDSALGPVVSPGNVRASSINIVCETVGVCPDLLCASQRPHGIWLLAQRACPAMFASNPAAGQLQLHPVTDNGTAVLSFNVPGTVRHELLGSAVAMPGRDPEPAPGRRHPPISGLSTFMQCE